MKKLAIAVLGLFGCAATVTPPGIAISAPAPTVAVEAGVGMAAGGGTAVATPSGAGPSCTGDAQCMNPDDILVCKGPKWDCRVSHTITQPSQQSKNQGQFLLVHDGTQAWTDRWYLTRPLAQGEQLRLGQPVLFELHRLDNRVWFAAPTHDEAIKTRWTFGRVTDLSDLFKGVVHVGSDGAHLSNIRVITSAGSDKDPP